MIVLLLIFVSFILSLIITPFVIKLCKTRNICSDPKRYKFYRNKKPMWGSLAFYPAVILPYIIVVFFTSIADADIIFSHSEINKIALSFFIATMIAFIAGLWSDYAYGKSNINWIFLFIGAVILHYSGFKFDLLAVPFVGTVEVGFWGILITLFWIVIITNIVEILNFIEGLSTVVLIILISIILYGSVSAKEVFSPLLLSCFLGGLLGFAFFQLHPNRIILGKYGTRFMGFMLASVILITHRKTTTTTIFIFPSVIMIFFAVLGILSLLEKTLILKNKDVIAAQKKDKEGI